MKHPLSPLLALLALALALTACAPAAPQSAATTETAPAAETAETAGEQAAFPVGKLVGGNALQQTADAYYVTEYDTLPDGSLLPRILKLDYASAREELFYALETPVLQFGEPLVRGRQLYFVADQTLYRIPLDGGEVAEFPVPAEFTGFSAADEYSAFCFYPHADGLHGDRLDLETGQITDLTLPPQTEGIYPVGKDRFILCRILTDAPLPDPGQNLEAYDAAMQNARKEYDWFDPATGELEKLFEVPYYGQEQPDGTRRGRMLLAMANERIYFVWSIQDNTSILKEGLESCDKSGGDWQQVPVPSEEAFYYGAALCQNEELRWIRNWTAGGDYRIYDLSTGENHSIPSLRELPGTETARPEALTGDGRCLLRTNYLDAQGGYRSGYALIDQADYLAGSTAWTPVQPYTG